MEQAHRVPIPFGVNGVEGGLLGGGEVGKMGGERLHGASCHQAGGLPFHQGSEGINGLTECQAVLSDRSRNPLLRTGKVGIGSAGFIFHLPRQRCLEDLADGAEVIVRNPLPEAQLGGNHHGLLIHEFQDTLYVDAFRRTVVQPCDESRLRLLRAERHYHARPCTSALGEVGGQGVGEQTLQGHRKNDVGKMRHEESEIKVKG